MIIIIIIAIMIVMFVISYAVLRSRKSREDAITEYMDSRGFDRRPVNDGTDGWIWVKKNNPDIKIAEAELFKMSLNQVKEKYV